MSCTTFFLIPWSGSKVAAGAFITHAREVAVPHWNMVVYILPLVVIFMLLVVSISTDNYILGLSTDVNSGDVDDTFAIMYIVTRGFFVKGLLSFARAALRWFIPFVQPCTIMIALESEGDIKLFVGQMKGQVYGPVTCVPGGFLTANYELIEVYQARHKVIFPHKNQPKYELVPVRSALKVHLLVIAGPTSCVFSTTGRVLYVGRMSVEGQRAELAGANAKEWSKECVEIALQNRALVNALPLHFSRRILCRLDPRSPLLATAAQLQLNPWAFSFVQQGKLARQFAESNQENGALLLAKMGLTYDTVWDNLDNRVKSEVANLAAKFSHWSSHESVVRNRILWAVVNFGGELAWRSDSCTSVSPPFSDLSSILKIEKTDMTSLEMFEFRVRNISSFTGLTREFVASVLSHTVLYDLYAVVLLKYNLRAERVAQDPKFLTWFNNHVQQFVDSSN